MSVNKENFTSLIKELGHVQLVAVSKTKPVEDIMELYKLGQRDFGENYVQELVKKAEALPKDIRWHFIGHLQTNKVKLIAPFVQLIQSVDSLKLLEEINKQAGKSERVIDCLLQIHIASEESKFGLDENELDALLTALTSKRLNNIRITGLMGMASFTDDLEKVRGEFHYLKNLFNEHSKGSFGQTAPQGLSENFNLQTLSMGMTSDYKIAIEEGSNMIRVGSLLFGLRN